MPDNAAQIWAFSAGSVHRAGGCFVRKLRDGVRDPAPDGGAVVFASGRELVGAHGAFRLGVVAVMLEHQGGAPDIDLRYHAANGRRGFA
jgi:hypothetical protein